MTVDIIINVCKVSSNYQLYDKVWGMEDGGWRVGGYMSRLMGICL